MFNPPPYPNSGSYMGLLKRITQGVQRKKVEDQIRDLLERAFEQQLESEKVVLSRPERVRLFQQVSKTVLTDALAKIDTSNK